MATDYGVDLAALDDLPEGDAYVIGEDSAAYQCARRLLTPEGGLADVGETTAYSSLDVRLFVGGRASAADLRTVEFTARAALMEEPVVDSARVSATLAGGRLTVQSEMVGGDGPFSSVLETDGLTVAILTE